MPFSDRRDGRAWRVGVWIVFIALACATGGCLHEPDPAPTPAPPFPTPTVDWSDLFDGVVNVPPSEEEPTGEVLGSTEFQQLLDSLQTPTTPFDGIAADLN